MLDFGRELTEIMVLICDFPVIKDSCSKVSDCFSRENPSFSSNLMYSPSNTSPEPTVDFSSPSLSLADLVSSSSS